MKTTEEGIQDEGHGHRSLKMVTTRARGRRRRSASDQACQPTCQPVQNPTHTPRYNLKLIEEKWGLKIPR